MVFANRIVVVVLKGHIMSMILYSGYLDSALNTRSLLVYCNVLKYFWLQS